ncbi:Ig-like domain-containing protein, partial [Buttiauxella gaviniae]|uniref:Ig-like domain-containing protein n=1 Tax=Buttiauxella gaviniae TaxID=82990 RepID=UPI0039B0EB15
TSTKAGISTVTAAINGTSRTVDVTFIADSSTATIATGNLTIVTNDAVANGTTTNSVKVTVTDANAHPLENQLVTMTADNSAVVGTVDLTDINGEVTVTLTSTKAGISTVTASINGSSQTVDVNFVADTSTATVSLAVEDDDALADLVAVNQVKATVTDVSGNPLANQTVNFSASNGASISSGSNITDANGIILRSLTNSKAGISSVTASIASKSSSVDLLFTSVPLEKIYYNGRLKRNAALDIGFPTKGFWNAAFRLGGAKENLGTGQHYSWSSDQAWVSVDTTGMVKMIAEPTSAQKTVTITAIPVAGNLPTFTYTFTINQFYIASSSGVTIAPNVNMTAATNFCANKGGGYRVPVSNELSSSTTSNSSNPQSGSLYTQWGGSVGGGGAYEMGSQGFTWATYYTSDSTKIADAYNGSIVNVSTSYGYNIYAACVRDL